MVSTTRNIDEFVEAASQARTSSAIWSQMEIFCQNHDLGAVAYILASREGDCGRLLVETSNLADQFDQDYIDAGAVEFDPFLLWGCNDYSSKKFGHAFAADVPGMAPNQVEFYDHAAKSGIEMAIGVPVALREEREYGGWIVGSSNCTVRQFELLQAEAGERVKLAGMIAHEYMCKLRRDECGYQNILSPRERECLIWLSLGLRTGQIADKLGISISAVRLYLGNARKKLGAKTREHSIALAIIRGEIIL